MASIATAQVANRGLVLLLGAAIFLNYVDRGAIAVAAPLMKTELGLSATTFGIAVSAFFWVYAPVQLLVGWLCDRFSVYKLMAGGIVLWAGSTLLTGLVGGFASLLVLRVMLGIGESIAFPGSSKIIARHIPAEQRGMANAAVAAGLALGPAIGTLSGGLIVASLGWRPMFIIFGLATLLWLWPWRQVVAGLPTSGHHDEGASVPVRAMLGQWALWAMSIGHAAGNYCFYFLLAWLPLYLVTERGFTIARRSPPAPSSGSVMPTARPNSPSCCRSPGRRRRPCRSTSTRSRKCSPVRALRGPGSGSRMRSAICRAFLGRSSRESWSTAPAMAAHSC
jgi:MFS family permease